MKYAEIALDLPINKTFHYNIPREMAKYVDVGKRVWVPFGRRRMIGYVVGLNDSAPVYRLRDIEKVIDENPILPDGLMRLTKWMSDYYCTSWGSTLCEVKMSFIVGEKYRANQNMNQSLRVERSD